MTDAEIERLLRSDAPIVIIEAPAGCGKTYQAASYAAEATETLTKGHVLVLTHTHAACSVVAERTLAVRDRVHIQTLDGFINQIATAYRSSLGLPNDVSSWTRENSYEELAEMIAEFLSNNSMICNFLASRYPVVLCDEHQDSNEFQDRVVRLIGEAGAKLRVFGDPMQIIPGGRNQRSLAAAAQERWSELASQGEFGNLETPHRWEAGDSELGRWVQRARLSLKEQGFVSLEELPNSVTILKAENSSRAPTRYILSPANSRSLSAEVDRGVSGLLVGSQTAVIEGVNGYLGRRIPIWEGHTRGALEKLVDLFESDVSQGEVSLGFIEFLQSVLTGFAQSVYGDRLVAEIDNLSESPRGNIPPELKAMAELIRSGDCHRGYCKAALHLRGLIKSEAQGFGSIHIDYPSELADLIKLSEFDSAKDGYAQISQKRSRSHPKPQRKALSTIHKSKGLEAENVVVFACDGNNFTDTQVKKNLLYVAMSRATNSLTLVLSDENPSPLFH